MSCPALQDAPAAYAASRALVNLTAAPANFLEVLHCLAEGLKVNSDTARTRTAQARPPAGPPLLLPAWPAFPFSSTLAPTCPTPIPPFKHPRGRSPALSPGYWASGQRRYSAPAIVCEPAAPAVRPHARQARLGLNLHSGRTQAEHPCALDPGLIPNIHEP